MNKTAHTLDYAIMLVTVVILAIMVILGKVENIDQNGTYVVWYGIGVFSLIGGVALALFSHTIFWMFSFSSDRWIYVADIFSMNAIVTAAGALFGISLVTITATGHVVDENLSTLMLASAVLAIALIKKHFCDARKMETVSGRPISTFYYAETGIISLMPIVGVIF